MSCSLSQPWLRVHNQQRQCVTLHKLGYTLAKPFEQGCGTQPAKSRTCKHASHPKGVYLRHSKQSPGQQQQCHSIMHGDLPMCYTGAGACKNIYPCQVAWKPTL